MKIAGFDWDDGNWPKCGKHGVSREEIEQVLLGTPAVMPDPHQDEPRQRAIGKTAAGRYVFLVFMRRKVDTKNMLLLRSPVLKIVSNELPAQHSWGFSTFYVVKELKPGEEELADMLHTTMRQPTYACSAPNY